MKMTSAFTDNGSSNSSIMIISYSNLYIKPHQILINVMLLIWIVDVAFKTQSSKNVWRTNNALRNLQSTAIVPFNLNGDTTLTTVREKTTFVFRKQKGSGI
jgi:hypothetical protein